MEPRIQYAQTADRVLWLEDGRFQDTGRTGGTR